MKNAMPVIIVIIIALFVLPWNRINWGKVSTTPGEVVTVVGEASKQEKNQIASFGAGVDAVSDKKEDAIKDVNEKVAALIKAAKEFGITEGDIKTQNMSVYQSEEMYWDNGVQKARKGQWRVSNTVEITLREVDRATDLTSVLTNSGANNVWGPNFRTDDSLGSENDLFEEAMNSAKEKAEEIARTSGRRLGKVLSVTEGSPVSGVSPLYARDMGGGGGGAPMEVGTSTVYKSLTVSFELK